MPRWRPLVVDSGTNFFLRSFILTPFCTPISYRHANVAPSGGGFRNYFFPAHFLPYSPVMKICPPPKCSHQTTSTKIFFFFNFICVSLSLIANDWWGPLVVTSGTIYSHTFRASRPLSPNISLPHCTPWRPFPRPPNGVHQINFTKIFLPSMKHVILLLNSLHNVPNK